jgi:hypothetical protein
VARDQKAPGAQQRRDEDERRALGDASRPRDAIREEVSMKL